MSKNGYPFLFTGRQGHDVTIFRQYFSHDTLPGGWMLELETRKLGYFEPWLSEPLLRHDVQWLDALVANAVPLPPLL